MKEYSGNRAPFAYALFQESDRERVSPVLEAMNRKGLYLSGIQGYSLGKVRRACAVIVFLSAAFAGDETMQERFFAVLDTGVSVIPVALDNAPLPETMAQAMFARNSILADRYPDADALAERILTAQALQNPGLTEGQKKASRRNLISVIAGAVAVMAAVVLLAVLNRPNPEPVVVSQEDPIAMYDLTEEELESIVNVVMVGDRYWFLGEKDLALDYEHGRNFVDCYSKAIRENEDNKEIWRDPETGAVIESAAYDLRFLGLLPNLRALHLAEVECDALPDLSGASRLTMVSLTDCRIADISGLAGTGISELRVDTTSVENYGALTGCTSLHNVDITLNGETEPDFRDFAPPKLQGFLLHNARPEQKAPEFSALKNCGSLRFLQMDGIGVDSLDFLPEDAALSELRIAHMPRLRDISALESLPRLSLLDIGDCPALRDLTPIGGCKNLTSLNLWTECDDTSFLDNLYQLKEVWLWCGPTNVNFLNNLSDGSGISLGLNCYRITDFSGLAAVKRFNELVLNMDDRSFEEAAPYLQEAYIQRNMEIINGKQLELSALPELAKGGRLCLENCGLENLEGIPQVRELVLRNLMHLRSLQGLEPKQNMELTIQFCPRLTDWSALYGGRVNCLSLDMISVLPDFGDFDIANTLNLRNMQELEDISCLDALPEGKRFSHMELTGLEKVTDLSPLKRLSGGYLGVDPQCALQAQKLVEEGNFYSMEVLNPDLSWLWNMEIRLESLEDLELLPKSVLSSVRQLAVYGDRIFERHLLEPRTIWENGKEIPVLWDPQRECVVPTGEGTIRSMEQLSALTGLECLWLYQQPLENLNGIQMLSQLNNLDAAFCPNLTDVSAAFALNNLEYVSFDGSPISSIQGIQNLERLRYLTIARTKVTDLIPLAECVGIRNQEEGFGLNLDETIIEDYSPVTTITRFADLNLANSDVDLAALFRQMCGTSVRDLWTHGGKLTDEALEALADNLQVNVLTTDCSGELTDLTPLKRIQGLQKVSLFGDTARVLPTLEGQTYSFELDVWD